MQRPAGSAWRSSWCNPTLAVPRNVRTPCCAIRPAQVDWGYETFSDMRQRNRCPSRNGASHHVRNHVGGFQKRLTLEMGVALSGLRLGMAQQVLHLVQGAPAVDEDRRIQAPADAGLTTAEFPETHPLLVAHGHLIYKINVATPLVLCQLFSDYGYQIILGTLIYFNIAIIILQRRSNQMLSPASQQISHQG